MAINLEYVFNLSQLAHPLFKVSGVGNIVFISSIAGLVAMTNFFIYCNMRTFDICVALQLLRGTVAAAATAQQQLSSRLLLQAAQQQIAAAGCPAAAANCCYCRGSKKERKKRKREEEKKK
uniref:Uncharacterized protein n=1 Tax=Ananas comosus var. bracteatus TaxID=296719 RepID=A0A6V7P1I6_ANACO|nr:unnamed protein product [Ananas comosus var. bracteatus]